MDEKQISKHGSSLQHLISRGLEIHSIGEYVAVVDQTLDVIGSLVVTGR